MSYQQKSVFASMVSTILILSSYWGYVLPKLQKEGQALAVDLKFWGATILIFIAISIVVRIVLEILLNIINAAITRQVEEPGFIDERDKHIERKGERVSYIFVGIGFLLSMVSLVLGQPAYVMINIQFSSFFIADLIGSCAQLYFYRKGG